MCTHRQRCDSLAQGQHLATYSARQSSDTSCKALCCCYSEGLPQQKCGDCVSASLWLSKKSDTLFDLEVPWMTHLELAIVACCHGIQVQLHQHILHAIAGIHQTQLQGKQACYNSTQPNQQSL